jgi:ParB family chromosome partitioning protein
MSKQREAIGKGIRALLQDIDEEEEGKALESTSSSPGSIVSIPLEKIEVNPFQPRSDFNEDALSDLSESIKIHGVIQPVTVRAMVNGSFQLIAGERRLRASQLAGLNEIPAYVRSANDQEALEIALIENIQREDLNAIEIGLNYQRLMDECELNQEELATRLGKKRATVTNYLRLLKLPPQIQAAIKERMISMGHARALAAVDEVDVQLDIYKDILSKGLSVRQVEQAVAKYKKKPTKKSKKKEEELSPELRRIQDRLTSHFGTKVKIKSGSGEKGEFIIPYFSADDFERILELLEE